jgi:N-acetylmuramoyl-L-alanine amidase
MTKDRMKRRLLRQAVDDNVDTIRGLAPKSLRRNRRWGRLALRGSLIVLLPVGIFGSSWLANNSLRSESHPAVAAAGGVALLPGIKVATTAPTTRTFPAPERIDPAVLSLGVKRIVIDAGHGGGNPGTISAAGMMEKELTLDIGRRLQALLEKDSFQVVMTRNGDDTVTLSDRARMANGADGDLFVSIHLNALRDRARRGVETYYLGPTNDPFLREIAAAENRESGYSLADMRQLLDGIYAGARQDESKRLAEAVQSSLYRDLRKITPSLQDRGVKTAPFVVLVTTDMPAILAEVSCLSNEEETRLLKTTEYRERIARALHAGIRSYAGGSGRSSEKGS